MLRACSDESMFPPSSFDYKDFAESCRKKFGVMPWPHWITTEYGGSVSLTQTFYFSLYNFVIRVILLLVVCCKMEISFFMHKFITYCLIFFYLCRELSKCSRDQAETLNFLRNARSLEKGQVSFDSFKRICFGHLIVLSRLQRFCGFITI